MQFNQRDFASTFISAPLLVRRDTEKLVIYHQDEICKGLAAVGMSTFEKGCVLLSVKKEVTVSVRMMVIDLCWQVKAANKGG